jgi:hypothetical protein
VGISCTRGPTACQHIQVGMRLEGMQARSEPNTLQASSQATSVCFTIAWRVTHLRQAAEHILQHWAQAI